ncbi:MAP kinase-activated protein kinase 5 [Branchiostoma belcheri]|nr:MAP kinase-activated protein kinase 5 [Branchiostoma belcheri]
MFDQTDVISPSIIIPSYRQENVSIPLTQAPGGSSSIVEDYEVRWRKSLGTGVSGPVRLCIKRNTGEKYALKCLLDSKKARTEVTLHQRCCPHPNIVQIYDVYCNSVQFPREAVARSRLLVVMELMNGGELFDQIIRERHFTEKKAAAITKQIVSAVFHCHSLNIAHRDLKPENLLLKEKSEDLQNVTIKLADFGFAKEDVGLVTPQFTPYYVAPQVLEAQKQQRLERSGLKTPPGTPYTYDKSCDMWSVGVIIYIMLCGYPPFFPETPSKQMTPNMKRKIMAGEYRFPKNEWSVVSDMAKDVIQRLLEVDPVKRMTVQQLIHHTWLLGEEAPELALLSPAIMQDKDALHEVMHAHAQQLTVMRTPDTTFQLKPLTSAENPILKKRLKAR